MTAVRRYICPVCKENSGVDILYGFPAPAAFEAAERREAVLGGCVVTDDDPERACTNCGHGWRITRRATET